MVDNLPFRLLESVEIASLDIIQVASSSTAFILSEDGNLARIFDIAESRGVFEEMVRVERLSFCWWFDHVYHDDCVRECTWSFCKQHL